MDIEQLKLVLQSVDGVTEGAKQIGIGWLALDFLKDLLGYGLGFYGISKATKLIYTIVEGMIATSRLGEIRDIVVPGQRGTSVSRGELNRIFEACRAGVTRGE
jgi:hypothetical protein